MTIDRVNPAGLARPSGFSHAVVATGSRIVFLAGQTATGPGGGIEGRTVAAQTEGLSAQERADWGLGV